jgi:NAD(P)-dependent dehydrogenase (short-subunit alcohol dehydrogenase family)/acyl carrier protein
MEHPELWGGLVDLPRAATAQGLLAVLASGDAEDQVALRDGRRWVARLQQRAPSPAAPATIPVQADATYIVTGGLGGVGLTAARRLVERGARHLVLTGRRAPSEAARAAIADLESRGCTIRVVPADITQEADVERMLEEIHASMPPLKGIVHAAGVHALCALSAIDRGHLHAMLAPKVAGGFLLDKLTAQRGIALAFFVSTSSIAAVSGGMGQAAYAAGNAYLDALAAQRQAAGRAATTINYGPWDRVGMGTVDEQGIAWLRSRGIRPLEPETAVDGLEAAIAGGSATTVVADINWTLFGQFGESQLQRPLFEKLFRASGVDPAAMGQAAQTALVERLQAVAPVERVDVLKQVVKAELAAVLRRRPEELDDDFGFFDSGMDSLMAVELINRLRSQLGGARFPASMVQAHPSIGQLATALASEIPGSGRDTRSTQPHSGAVAPAEAHASIAEGGEVYYQIPGGPRYTYRRYRPGDKESAIDSFRSAFGEKAARTLATFFDWKYLQNPLTPDTGPIVDVLECDGRIVGMNGGACARFKLGDTTIAGVWGCDSHVVEEHRKATSWFLYQVHENAPAALLGTPNAAMYPFAAATGAFADLDELVDLRAAIDMRSVLESRGVNPLLAWGCGLMYRSASRILGLIVRARIPKQLSVAQVPEFDSRFDELWQTVSRDYPGIMVRDQTFLSWRFDRCPDRHYTRYVVERDGRLAGYLVTREQRMDGRIRGIIVDFLVPRDDAQVLDCLVSKAMSDFAAHGVEAVILPLAASQRQQIRLLRWHGFLLRRHRAQLIARKGPLLDSAAGINDWFSTFADGDGDYNESESDPSAAVERAAPAAGHSNFPQASREQESQASS